MATNLAAVLVNFLLRKLVSNDHVSVEIDADFVQVLNLQSIHYENNRKL